MEEEHQDLDKPIYGALRHLKITQSREEKEESTNQQRHYSLRENPKKKIQKSPEPMKKTLFRCEECGKGFRYEKCFSNHLAVMHSSTNQKVYEESMMSLCCSFSRVRKKKRSSLMRYKKTSLSESRSVFVANDDELEVADCLILLSKSSPKVLYGLKLESEAVDVTPETPKGSYDLGCLRNKKPRKGCEFESGYFSNEQRLMEEGLSSYETLKEPGSFLSDDNRLDQQKERKVQRHLEEEVTPPVRFKGPMSFLGEKHELDKLKHCKASDFESGLYRTELGVRGMECTEMIAEPEKKNVEHQCRLCNKVFSSYQALGGHQTFHRMNTSKNKKDCREESVEPEDESVRCSTTKRRRQASAASFQGVPARFML
ncbi:hypothetical protein CARUB_v10002724mg [Capsella rubella]|uniref:C2H2-type domain-containing protein n=1 Tax=Capsella rubella TaxID=81985 RepID=R0FJ92_9BRAS|nr:uncharacterized protein LOC17881681 [Capsella rubella]EOA22156.1 hypothetical protein CARUB_v10002724mg [Capsella rubella]